MTLITHIYWNTSSERIVDLQNNMLKHSSSLLAKEHNTQTWRLSFEKMTGVDSNFDQVM